MPGLWFWIQDPLFTGCATWSKLFLKKIFYLILIYAYNVFGAKRLPICFPSIPPQWPSPTVSPPHFLCLLSLLRMNTHQVHLVLPARPWVWDHLLTPIPGDIWLLLPSRDQLSIAPQTGLGLTESPHPHAFWNLGWPAVNTSLESCARSLTRCGFICANLLLCSAYTISPKMSTTSDSYSLSDPSFMMIPEPWGEGLWYGTSHLVSPFVHILAVKRRP